MGKNEVGGPKWLANKMKSKGLQKLRWYCQMCQKQCRDENGFKCHTMSEVSSSSPVMIFFIKLFQPSGTSETTVAVWREYWQISSQLQQGL